MILPPIDEAGTSPLAQNLFDVSGVTRVFLGSDFISITKDADADWKHVRPMALAAIMDHFVGWASGYGNRRGGER